MSTKRVPRKVGFLLFEGFELLDIFGPAEMFGLPKQRFSIEMIGLRAQPVQSAQGPKVLAERGFTDVDDLDVVLVPGGMGTRTEVDNEALLAWIRAISESAEFVTSVCTGSALLARAGVLDGRQATSNKSAFEWVMSQGPAVNWVKQARWVEDGKYWTSSGVTAGIDMALALIEKLEGAELAEMLANMAEYERHSDSSWDPFAKLYPFTED